MLIFVIFYASTEKEYKLVRIFEDNKSAFQTVANQLLEGEGINSITKENYDTDDANLKLIFTKTNVLRIYRDYPVINAVSFEIDVSWINYYGIVYLPNGGKSLKESGAFDLKALNEDNWFILMK